MYIYNTRLLCVDLNSDTSSSTHSNWASRKIHLTTAGNRTRNLHISRTMVYHLSTRPSCRNDFCNNDVTYTSEFLPSKCNELASYIAASESYLSRKYNEYY